MGPRRVLLLSAVVVSSAIGVAGNGAAAPTSSPYQRAAAKVRRLGYTPFANSRSMWQGPFNAILARLTRSGDGYAQHAFFFYRGRYLGKDTRNSSHVISEVWRTDRTISISYTLYRNSDPNCCPTGGAKFVRFRWNGTRVVALDRIPPLRGPLHR